MPPATDLPPSQPPSPLGLAAFRRAGMDALTPTVQTLVQFELIVRPTLLEVSLGEIPDLSAYARHVGRAGIRLVIAATHKQGLARRLAVACQVPIIRIPLTAEASPAAGLAALTEGLTNNEAEPVGPNAGLIATVALGEAGARNAALLAIAILALRDERLRVAWRAFRAQQTQAVLSQPPPRE